MGTHKGNGTPNRHRLLLTILVILTLSACGTTHRFVEQPQTVAGTDLTPRQATQELFDGVAPYSVSLCEADPISKHCKKGSDGVRANEGLRKLTRIAGMWSGVTRAVQSVLEGDRHATAT